MFAAALLAFTIFFYAVVYTMWLKRSTPQNIVIGGLAGALPPAIAWAAKTGSLALDPLLLVAIIFMWTPPHFWALSLLQKHDYAAAKVPMLPVTARRQNHARAHLCLFAVASRRWARAGAHRPWRAGSTALSLLSAALFSLRWRGACCARRRARAERRR